MPDARLTKLPPPSIPDILLAGTATGEGGLDGFDVSAPQSFVVDPRSPYEPETGRLVTPVLPPHIRSRRRETPPPDVNSLGAPATDIAPPPAVTGGRPASGVDRIPPGGLNVVRPQPRPDPVPAPERVVTFDVPGFGTTQAQYHTAERHDTVLVLGYDTRYAGGSMYMPSMGVQNVDVDVHDDPYVYRTDVLFIFPFRNYRLCLLGVREAYPKESEPTEY